MPEFSFEGTSSWRSGTECDLTIKGKQIVTVSPPPEFGGKEGYCVPEEVFAAALASCMNTLFILIAKNSNLALKNLETKAIVKMNAEGLEKLIFTNIHFNMKVKLEKDNDWERKKANRVYRIAQKVCPLRQSWGENVPITFELNFLQDTAKLSPLQFCSLSSISSILQFTISEKNTNKSFLNHTSCFC